MSVVSALDDGVSKLVVKLGTFFAECVRQRTPSAALDGSGVSSPSWTATAIRCNSMASPTWSVLTGNDSDLCHLRRQLSKKVMRTILQDVFLIVMKDLRTWVVDRHLERHDAASISSQTPASAFGQ